MNPVDLGGGKAGRGGLGGKICRRNMTGRGEQKYPCGTMRVHGVGTLEKTAFYIGRYRNRRAAYRILRQNVGISTRYTDTNCDLNVRSGGNLRPSVCL